jgi:hypothetical protein
VTIKGHRADIPRAPDVRWRGDGRGRHLETGVTGLALGLLASPKAGRAIGHAQSSLRMESEQQRARENAYSPPQVL